MTHDNPASPVDATTTQPDEIIEPAAPQADAALEAASTDDLSFDTPAQLDEAPLPETALPSDAVPSFTESHAPASESSAPAGDVTLALTPFDSIEPDAALAPAEETTESLVNEPAPADMAAIAAVASLSAPETEINRDGSCFSSEDERPTFNEDHTPTVTAPRRLLSGGWTMGLLLSGIAIIAACVLIPQGDETRKLMYEREKLRADLEQVEKQVATNDEFLKKVQTDPTLAERLAQRQMKLVPAGTKVLDVEDASPTKDDKSPFLIVSVPPPAPMPPYQPRGGYFSQLCRNGRSQLYMIGGGLMLVAAGLVLGASGPRD